MFLCSGADRHVEDNLREKVDVQEERVHEYDGRIQRFHVTKVNLNSLWCREMIGSEKGQLTELVKLYHQRRKYWLAYLM